MEHLLAQWFGNYLCKHNIIEEEYTDVYVYGAELFLSFVITTVIIAIIAVVTHTIWISIAHLIVFISLRRFTGGYHAQTHLKCKLITIAVYLAVIVSAHYIDINWFTYIVLLIVGNSIIFYKAPVENHNKPLTEREIKKFRLLSHIVFTLFSIGGIILSLFYQLLGNTVFFSLLSVIGSITVTVFMKGGEGE